MIITLTHNLPPVSSGQSDRIALTGDRDQVSTSSHTLLRSHSSVRYHAAPPSPSPPRYPAMTSQRGARSTHSLSEHFYR
ncbi:hypothetical protein J6590_074275 [Homalodisca vitripennis]|nr:hypothetical protein J6590_074275 [Homalodisca vitripennis]